MQAISARRGRVAVASCLIALLVAASLVAVAPQPAHAASVNTKACKAYKEMLAKKNFKWIDTAVRSSSLKFVCQDINKDGVKDLVVSNSGTNSQSIYTYKKGKVKHVGTFVSPLICQNKNFVSETVLGYSYWYQTYYRLDKNGKLKKLASWEAQMFEPPEGLLYEKAWFNEDVPLYYFNWTVNGKSVTHDQCMAFIQSLEKDAKKIDLKFVKNTAANRAKYLKASSAPVKLSATSKTIAIGKTYTIKVKNAGKKSIVWSSSNKKVATVSTTGKVKAKRSGKATITAKVGGKKLTCKITVASHKELARQSLNGWWHTSSSGGHYMYVKNGKAYLFPTHFGDNGAIINRTSDMKKAKISFTRTTTAPGSSEKRSGYRVRISGNSYYYYDNDHKLLENRYGTGYRGYSGSSSMYKVNANDVPAHLRQYVKRF